MEIQVASLHVKHFCFVVFIIPGLYSAVRGLSLSNRSRSVSSLAFLNNSKNSRCISVHDAMEMGRSPGSKKMDHRRH